jgi:regulator of protease activity HflC (stomatin/prohibitin superfamily)
MEQQMSAERERRALIADAEGKKYSKINRSEGLKAELVNKSEGEMQGRINEAEGRASEIESIANATAEAVEKVAKSISIKGGKEAVRLQLSERYLSNLNKLAKPETSILYPADLTKIDDLLESLGLKVAEK